MRAPVCPFRRPRGGQKPQGSVNHLAANHARVLGARARTCPFNYQALTLSVSVLGGIQTTQPSPMELESRALPTGDSTQAKAALKHVTVKKQLVRRPSGPKPTVAAQKDRTVAIFNARAAHRETDPQEPQRNGMVEEGDAPAAPRPMLSLDTSPQVLTQQESGSGEQKEQASNAPDTQPDNSTGHGVLDGETQPGPVRAAKRTIIKAVNYAAAKPARSDRVITEEDIRMCVGYKANIYDTSLAVCTIDGCNRYYTRLDKFTAHRKREHDTTDIEVDMWMFGNLKSGDSSANGKAEGGLSKDSPVNTMAAGKETLGAKASSPDNGAIVNSVDKESRVAPSDPQNRQRKQKLQQELSASSGSESSPLGVKRGREQAPEDARKEMNNSNKRREILPTQSPNAPSEPRQMQMQQPRPQRRYPEEEALLSPDARMRYQRGNHARGPNPMYGLPYDADPRYYNPLQMHPMSFGLSPYTELPPPPPPPRYDGGYGEMAYAGFYGGAGGNRRFMNSPQPPPPRRSR